MNINRGQPFQQKNQQHRSEQMDSFDLDALLITLQNDIGPFASMSTGTKQPSHLRIDTLSSIDLFSNPFLTYSASPSSLMSFLPTSSTSSIDSFDFPLSAPLPTGNLSPFNFQQELSPLTAFDEFTIDDFLPKEPVFLKQRKRPYRPRTLKQCETSWPTDQIKRRAYDAAANGSTELQCEFPGCGKTFERIQNLRSHWCCHSSEKPFVCDDCGFEFRRLPDLHRHRRTLHDGGKPHQCDACGKRFPRADTLKHHLKQQDCGQSSSLPNQ